MSSEETPGGTGPPTKRHCANPPPQFEYSRRELEFAVGRSVPFPRERNENDAPLTKDFDAELAAAPDPSSCPTPPVNILEALPTELVAKCFYGGYVDSLAVIGKVSCVSKRTEAIAKQAVKFLDLRSLGNLTPELLQNLVSRFHNVSEVDLTYCSKVTGEHLLMLVPWSKTLKHLRLKGTNVSNEDINVYLEAARQHLEGEPTRLEEIDLSANSRAGSNKIGDGAVAAIVTHCPYLRSLKLGWCKQVKDTSVSRLKSLSCLTTLDLSLTSMTDEGCRALFTIKSLRQLDLSATHIGSHGLRNLFVGSHHAERPPQLATLHLRHVQNYISSESLDLLGATTVPLTYVNVEHSSAAKHTCVLRKLKQKGADVVGAKYYE